MRYRPQTVSISFLAQKIIIDTDPGIDDAMAIFLALRSPELRVIGLTTIFGNVHTTLSTTNALRLLEIAGQSHIPVAHGADAPLARAYGGPVAFIHGEDGQGNANLPLPRTTAIAESAAEFIVKQIIAAPGEITLVPIGPLTNIAAALALEPAIAEQVKEIVLMGGNAFVPGNASPAAEANIHNDPEAADLVFGASWQVTMVGLDVTQEIIMSSQQNARLEAAQNPLAQHLARINDLYLEFNRQSSGIDGYYIHDPSAIVYLTHPELFTVEKYPVRVETQGISVGKTWPSTTRHHTHPDWADRPKVAICTAVNANAVLETILERLAYDAK
jgi:inosine-uridine nucleoside N-ribohydrolase